MELINTYITALLNRDEPRKFFIKFNILGSIISKLLISGAKLFFLYLSIILNQSIIKKKNSKILG